MNIRSKLTGEINELKDFEEDYPGQKDEIRRSIIVRASLAAADEILMEFSDGSIEELDHLTTEVAARFVDKLRVQAMSKLTKADMDKRSNK